MLLRFERLRSLRVWGILVLALGLWVGCSDDDKREGTEKAEEKETTSKSTSKETTSKSRSKETTSKSISKKAEPKTTLGEEGGAVVVVSRAPQRTYLWAPAVAEDGDWGGVSRATMDNYCSGAAVSGSDDAVVGRPRTITDANADYITKALALGHDINNFAELGAAAVTEGADAKSLDDGVYSLSLNGLVETKLADNYLAFHTDAWRTSLEDGLLADADDVPFWIGATEDGGANAGTRDSANNFFNCNNFNSNLNRTTRDLDEGTVIMGGAMSTDHDDDVRTAEVSPLRIRIATAESVGFTCNALAKVLCISFSKR